MAAKRIHLIFIKLNIDRTQLKATPGTDRALKGLSVRVSFENKMNEATKELERNYSLFEQDFKEFFPLLVKFVEQQIT